MKSRADLIRDNKDLRGKIKRLDKIEAKFKRSLLDALNLESLSRHILIDKPKKS